MINFPKPTDTIAGIQKFWFIPVRDVYTLGDIILSELQSITFKPDKDWLTAYGVFNTKEFSENKKENKSGIRFDRMFEMFYPGYSLAVMQQMEKMKLQRFIIAFLDNNENYKIAGTIENPLNFTYKLTTGKSGADAQGFEMKFGGDGRIRIYKGSKDVSNVDWILSTGFWNDNNIWIDTALWID